MTDERRPIEPLIRSEPMPEDAFVVVRGGPIAAEKIVEHARRQEAVFTFRGRPMVAISVDLTVAGWTLERILAERMRTRTRYATATAGAVRAAGYELIPSGTRPHYSLVLPGATFADAVALLALFGPTLENPFRGRR